MSIRIEKERCVGCMACKDVCPGSLIQEKDGKAYMKYPKDCWGCASCVKECQTLAIHFYLGADIGGDGSFLTITQEEGILHWNFVKSDGSRNTIHINRKNSNQY